jgi:hypothetical protein
MNECILELLNNILEQLHLNDDLINDYDFLSKFLNGDDYDIF